MLVFPNDRKKLRHIEERVAERAQVNFKWLLEIVEDINRYLPDDWRMTRSGKNAFSILIVADKTLQFVGQSFKIGENRILSVIGTIYEPHYFHKDDLRALGISKKKEVTSSIKKEHPELIIPNLYFFRPCPENSISPLFARQYEKIKKNKKGKKVGDEYHRIHPLTKSGLDLEHFRWIRWTINGDAEFVNTINSEYHGKDYWDIQELNDDKSKNYFNTYKSLLEKHNIKPYEKPEIAPTPYEVEYKFMVPGSKSDATVTFELVDKAVKEKGFNIVSDKKTAQQVDLYFDDEELTLHSIGASFRLRKKKDNIRVTVKKRLPAKKGYSEEGLYERVEEEAVISQFQEKALLAGEPINVFPYRLIAYIAPYCRTLKPIVKVINDRRVLNLKDSNNCQVELCLDNVSYEINSKTVGPYFEIEIESKGSPRESVRDLANFLEENLGLIPSHQSKYERGISLLKTVSIPKERKLVIIDTDCGVDDALALILAFKSPELEVKAITTVSGNVHIDKVVPNVFKVLNAVGLKDFPIVARGAENPLIKSFEPVPSVHGNDGLGDVDSIPQRDNILLDTHPAWKIICNVAREYPKQVTLITIGPMTNLALAIQNDPESISNLKEVVAMGGVFFEIGNREADAEFNVYSDPDAAAKVVEFCRNSYLKIPVENSKIVPLTFVGLDVTHKVLLRRAYLERLVKAHSHNKLLKFVRDISKKYMDFYEGNEGLPGCYLHDPLAVAYVINPEFLDIEKHIINVETRGQFTSGVIFPDDRPTRNPQWRNPTEEVIGIAQHVEREAFEEFFIKRLIES